ncbi:leucine-rich repeat and transmembrane domain-containing protein 2-like [Acropora muricata]|uniref:leucine-rich repeat and transmembrane domain-containing protein 2-like n=1 Tax=Acropora muricata TaxID=159855 RepID=UPI0034E3B9AA
MKRFWLCAVAILSVCNLSHSDVCRSLCSCYNYAHDVNCGGRGVNSNLLLNISFPTNMTRLSLYNNEITHLPENVFSGLGNLRSLSLRWNKISQLPETIFSNLTKLTSL